MNDTKITLHIDESIQDLAIKYIDNRQRDISAIAEALKKGDYEPIRIIGHNTKGTGSAYGFDFISEIGDGLEQAAMRGDSATISKLTADLADYLRRIDVVFD